MRTVFDSGALPEDERLDRWLEINALASMTQEFRLLDPSVFGLRVAAATLGSVQISAVSHGPLVARRTPRMIRRSDPEMYQIALVRRGRQGIEQARNHALLGPGDLVLVDSSRPFDAFAEAHGAMSGSVLLQFPKRLLPLPESKVVRLVATTLPGTRGMGRLLAQFMTATADEAASYTPRDHARLGHVAVDLAAAVLAHHTDDESAVPPGSGPDVLFLRATAFIERHLHTAELTPASIASIHRISTRQLQRIFRTHGTSVSAYIRHRRLDRCRRDLADPNLGHLPVHAVGARWGLTRPDDFNRAFRVATGMTPGAYRSAVTAATNDFPILRARPRAFASNATHNPPVESGLRARTTGRSMRGEGAPGPTDRRDDALAGRGTRSRPTPVGPAPRGRIRRRSHTRGSLSPEPVPFPGRRPSVALV